MFRALLSPRNHLIHKIYRQSRTFPSATERRNLITSMARRMSSSSSSTSAKFTNRLAEEKSPYLLQHAHNPVNWWPWGDEAIQKAKSENKLIFLSVGYSTCHWCHVMEKESFENEEIAKVMNENFINIKVDREERPDIDKIYMNFLLMSKGSGGWPMSVWLTPNLAPIAAGTYYPPTDRWGTPGFKRVLLAIAEKWNSDKDTLQETGQRVLEIIQKSISEKSSEIVFEPGSSDQKLAEAINIFKRRYDSEFGGFGSHPKFPEVSRINFLFHAYIVTKDTEILDIAVNTLKKIGKGGIHDHVFGGFARYSVDRQWHVPHFEKMLYDQGQLMSSYANAYKLTKDRAHLVHADKIFRYLMKDLRHPLGGFYAGEDADSLPAAGDTVKVEGAFYAWEYNEVRDEIAENSDQFPDYDDVFQVFDIYCYHYNLKENGNVEPTSDPHGHLLNKNIPIVKRSLQDTCDKFQIEEEKLKILLDTVNEILHKVRDKRPRPHLDTKIITAWNGLILSGLSKLACCCDIGAEKRNEYMQAAKELIDFLKKYSFDKDDNVLLRSVYGEENSLADIQSEKIHGFLDDYAFLIKGLLDYYKASLDFSGLEWAKELQDIQNQHFWDEKYGGFFYSQANNPNVIIRLKEDHDGGDLVGRDNILQHWMCFMRCFSDGVAMAQCEFSVKLLEQDVTVGLVGTMLTVRLTHRNLASTFPDAVTDIRIRNKLLQGSPLRLPLTVLFEFDNQGKISCYDPFIDFANGLYAVLRSYEDVANVLDSGNIDTSGQIRGYRPSVMTSRVGTSSGCSSSDNRKQSESSYCSSSCNKLSVAFLLSTSEDTWDTAL